MHFSTAVLLLALPLVATALPLDDYVNKPDDSYAWELANHVDKGDYDLYVLKLTSQTWLSEDLIDKPVWQHWVRIVVPKGDIPTKSATIYANGGGNPLGNAPSSTESYLVEVALRLRGVVAELNQIPNQPIVFRGWGEDFGRSEDSLLAKSWDIFIASRDPEHIARLAMVKAVVKCMDSMQEFLPTLGRRISPSGFVIAGGSKRGWTTWLTGAVDKRVIAIVPIVIDVLDMQPNFNEVYRTYGRWPAALKDYSDQNVTRCLFCPAIEELAAVEDPLTYLDRFKERNIPIAAMNAVGDEFFIPVAWRNWFNRYDGEKHIRYLPNAEHSMATAIDRLVDTLSALWFMVEYNVPRPVYEWSFSNDYRTLTLKTEQTPTEVRLVQATNNRFGRRFIVNCYLTCFFRPTVIEPTGNNTYTVTLEEPLDAYTAYLLEFDFEVGFTSRLTLSTGVAIIPDQYEYGSCPDSECKLCETCQPDPTYGKVTPSE